MVVLEVVVRSKQPSGDLVGWLERWSYLEETQPGTAGERRDGTLLLVLARLLEPPVEAGLMLSLARLADLVIPTMARETGPLERRKHELLVNNVRNPMTILFWCCRC